MSAARLDPLKTKLTRPWRRALTVFWVMCFFVISPIIILYTAGYRYNAQDGLKRTGVISIDIAPEDAQVFLNDILIEDHMPLKLDNRTPGRYHIRIQKEGFHPWNQDVLVLSNQTTYIRDVQLIENHSPRSLNIADEIIDVFRGIGDIKYLIKRGSVYELIEFDTRRERRTSLVRFSSVEKPIIYDSGTGHIGMLSQTEHGQKLYIVDVQGDVTSHTFGLDSRLTFMWARDDADALVYAKHDNQVDALLKNGKRRHIASTEAPLWFVDDEMLYIIKDGQLIRRAEEDIPLLSIRSDHIIQGIHDISESKIILETENGLDILKLEDTKIEESRHIFSYHTRDRMKDQRILAWSWWELWELFADGGATLLNRSSEKIVDVHELDGAETLLLQTDMKLIAFNAGYFVSSEIFTADHIHNVAVDQKNRTIVLHGSIDGSTDLYLLAY